METWTAESELPPPITKVMATFLVHESATPGKAQADLAEANMTRALSTRSVYSFKCLSNTLDVCLPPRLDHNIFMHLSALETCSQQVLVLQWQNVIKEINGGHLIKTEDVEGMLFNAFKKEQVEQLKALRAPAVVEEEQEGGEREQSTESALAAADGRRRLARKSTPIDCNAVAGRLDGEDLVKAMLEAEAKDLTSVKDYIAFMKMCRFHAVAGVL